MRLTLKNGVLVLRSRDLKDRKLLNRLHDLTEQENPLRLAVSATEVTRRGDVNFLEMELETKKKRS